MKSLTLRLILISLLSSASLYAARPDIGTIEKEINPPNIEKKQATIPEIKTKEYRLPLVDSGKTILVKDFLIIGNEHISSNNLEKFYKDFKGKELTFNQLQEIAVSITKYYRDNGYFVARAYIPKQNMKDSVLEIEIIEGAYGELKLINNSLIKDSVLQGMLDDAKSRSDIVSDRSLERSMLIIQDTPGAIITRSDILPGQKVGSSDFNMTADASKRYEGFVVVDNTGSRYTGKNRLMLGADINSPFSLGDKISFFGLVSDETDLKNGKLSYLVPLMSNGLKGELSYSQTNYSLIKEYASLDAVGTSKTFEGKLNYPIIRTRRENLDTSIILANKDIKDEVRTIGTSVEKNIKSISIGLDYDKSYLLLDKSSLSKVSFTMTYGDLSFDDSADLAIDRLGPDTNGKYSKINLDLSNSLVLTNEITLESSLKMQYALNNKNLDRSEDISIGGSSGVKLYPDGEQSAENGYLFNIEAKYQLPQINYYNQKIGVFYDRGRVYMADNSNVNFNSSSLQDIGVGYYASYKDFFGQVQVAWNLNSKDVTSEPNRNSRVLFQVGFVF